ncbi:helix-turn-helix domain-containing protein [Arthrobacter alpinus]|nr:helix-turn-helix domain-containing protein [Arthrobacter alpinus]
MTSPAAHGTSTSSTTAAGIELLERHLSLLWRRARAINYQLTSNVHPDLEPAAYGLLNILMHQGGMRLTDLARRVGVGKPTVSRQIAVLLSLGLVAKEEHPRDGRAQVIDLTLRAWRS